MTTSVHAEERLKPSLSQGMHAKFQAEQYVKQEQFVKAAQTYEKAADFGLSRNHALWKAVNFYIKAEQPVLALPALEKLVQNGDRQYRYFEMLKPHYSGEHLEQLQALAEQMKNNSTSHVHHKRDASRIVVEDVSRFFEAFDQAQGQPLDKQIKLYEKLYFDQASPGMVDYATFKISNIEAFVKHVEAARPYYEDVRAATAKLQALKPKVIKTMAAMRAYVPDAQAPDVYFVVGMHSSAGTASENGLLLGADFITGSHKNLGFIPQWTQPFLSTSEDKLWIIMHEYVHFIQNTNHETVLGNALVEGGADFIANLLYGKPKKTSLYTTFGQQHEARVKKRFLENLDSTDLSLWSGNNGAELEDNWVPDLGYFIGAQIAEGYYQQAQDKKQAIVDLLELKDPKAILKLSGYGSEDASQ